MSQPEDSRDEPQHERNARAFEPRVDPVRQVAAGIAHEFANALTAIAGIAHLMQGEHTFDQQLLDQLRAAGTERGGEHDQPKSCRDQRAARRHL